MIDIQDKRRLGNGLLQILVLMDIRKDLTVPDYLIAHYEDKIFIILIDDLHFGEESMEVKGSSEGKPLLDDGFGGDLMILVTKL